MRSLSVDVEATNILHLGYFGLGLEDEVLGERIIMEANSLPGFKVYGVDLIAWESVNPPFIPIQADFLSGLECFPDASLDRIVSNQSVGHHIENGDYYAAGVYTPRVLALSWKKLKMNGIMEITAQYDVLHWIFKLAREMRMNPTAPTSRFAGKTYWDRFYDDTQLLTFKRTY